MLILSIYFSFVLMLFQEFYKNSDLECQKVKAKHKFLKFKYSKQKYFKFKRGNMSLRREKEKQSKNISPFLGIDVKFDDVEKLQEALESQVDIVLRLEEERLKLLKENKHQK